MMNLTPTSAGNFAGLANESMTNTMMDLITNPVAEVVSNCETAANLAAVAAEDVPKFLPQIYGNTFVVANEVGKVGHNLATLAKNVDGLQLDITLIRGRTNLALLVGGGAALGLYYLYKKHKNLAARVTYMEHEFRRSK